MRRLDARERWGLAACVAAALALRLPWLGRADLWSDEIQTLHAVSLPLGDLVAERLGAGHVPLYFLLLKAWTAVAGTSEAALRAPSALLGGAALVPAFLLLRRLVPAAPALAGTLLLAVHPVWVELAREARMYPLLALLFLVVAESAVAADDEGRVPRRFWAAAALGPLVHATWGFGVVALAGWALAQRRSADGPRRRALTLVLAGLGASAALLLLQLGFADAQRQILTRRPWFAEAAVFVLRPWLAPRPETWFPAALVAIPAWIAAALLGWRRLDARARRLAALLVLVVPLASLASGLAAGVPWGPARYVQLATLGAVLLACAGIVPGARDPADVPLDEDTRRARAVALRAPVFFLVVTLLLLDGVAIGTAPTHFRRGGREVDAAVPAGETVWVADEATRMQLAHYSARDVRTGVPPDGAPHWRAHVREDDGRRSVAIVLAE